MIPPKTSDLFPNRGPTLHPLINPDIEAKKVINATVANETVSFNDERESIAKDIPTARASILVAIADKSSVFV